MMHNIYFLLKLYINVYLIDIVLNFEKNETDLFLVKERQATLWLIFVVTFLPFGFLHYLDYRKNTWKVGGASRALLQKNLLRKFLNYNEASRTELNQGHLIMAMTRDTIDLVHDGYIQTLSLLRAFGQLFVICVFQLTAPFIFNLDIGILGLVPNLTYPMMICAFLHFRSQK